MWHVPHFSEIQVCSKRNRNDIKMYRRVFSRAHTVTLETAVFPSCFRRISLVIHAISRGSTLYHVVSPQFRFTLSRKHSVYTRFHVIPTRFQTIRGTFHVRSRCFYIIFAVYSERSGLFLFILRIFCINVARATLRSIELYGPLC